MKRLELQQLEVDARYEGLSIVTALEAKTAKNGKTYYSITFSDGGATILANLFDPDMNYDYNDLAGKIVEVGLKTQLYNGNISYLVDTITLFTPVTEEVKKEFIQFSSNYDYYKQNIEELPKFIDLIQDESIQRICRYVFLEKFVREFRTYPAAKSNHHVCCGGLLEHSLSLAKQAYAAASHYAYEYKLDTDILIAGALFQDVGKIVEFDVDEFYNATYSAIGSIKGHITISNEILYQACFELGISPDQDKITRLSHIILSHHGKLEYGSPMVPKTPEAILIAHLDMLDAHFKAATSAIKSTKAKEKFTSRIYALDNNPVLMPDAALHTQQQDLINQENQILSHNGKDKSIRQSATNQIIQETDKTVSSSSKTETTSESLF